MSECTIDVAPSADKRRIVITLHSPDAEITVGMMIRMLVNYLKHVAESEGLRMKDFAIRPGDKTEVIAALAPKAPGGTP